MFDQTVTGLKSSVNVVGSDSGPLPSELELVLKVLFKWRENNPSVEFMIEILTMRSGDLPVTLRDVPLIRPPLTCYRGGLGDRCGV